MAVHVFVVMAEFFDGVEYVLDTWVIPLNPPSLFIHCELCHISVGSLTDFGPWTVSLKPFGHGWIPKCFTIALSMYSVLSSSLML